MKLIETDFTKELSALLVKHKKVLTSDKSGIYIVDWECGVAVMTTESEVASEDSRNFLVFINR